MRQQCAMPGAWLNASATIAAVPPNCRQGARHLIPTLAPDAFTTLAHWRLLTVDVGGVFLGVLVGANPCADRSRRGVERRRDRERPE